MKTKVLSLVISLAVLPFASCSDEAQELVEEQSQPLNQIVMTMQDFQPEAASRTLYEVNEAVECTWAANDTVGIFPDKGAQAYFPMASGAGTQNAAFDGEGWALKDGRTYGAYYPFIGAFYLDRNAVPVNYAGQTQVGNASTAHLGAYDFMVAAPTVSVEGAAQFAFKHLSALAQLKFTVPEPTSFTQVRLIADTKSFALQGKVDIMAQTPAITPVTTSKEITIDLIDVATTAENQEVTLYLMVPPVDLSGQSLKAMIVSDKGTQEVALEGKNFQSGIAYRLSGNFESTDLGYKDGVVRMAEAGTLAQLLGDGYLDITSLKVVGPINGDDVRCLRQMLGGSEFSDGEKGKLASLDLSDATVVAGGGAYYQYSQTESYYTSNNVIGRDMFYKCSNLQDIVLPDDVTLIDSYAFYGCSSLASISIPADVTSIGITAFGYCDSLKSVHIADLSAWCKISYNDYASSPLVSGGKLYLNNEELTALVIPEEITEIKDYAFRYCSNLTSVTMGEGVTSIGSYAFSGCSNLASIEIPVGVTTIGDNSFSGCSSLSSINLPDGITSIGDYMFYNCSSLATLVIPAGVTSIGKYAFKNCSLLASIDIPAGVTSIGESAFENCSNFTSIHIPAGVTSIGSNTFRNCSSLTSINIPDGITSISNWAFYACSSLKSVYVSDLSVWCKISFYGVTANPLCYKAKLYVDNVVVTDLVVPAEITEIKDYAFYNYTSLTSVTMGAGVTSIGDEAFSWCI